MRVNKDCLLKLSLSLWALVGATEVSAQGPDAGDVFQAPLHDAAWQTASSVFECKLHQAIPLFGNATFYHRAGENLEFNLAANGSTLSEYQVQLRSVPPPWKLSASEKHFGFIDVLDSELIRLETNGAKQMISEMLAGMMPTFSGRSSFDPEKSVEVVVSPLRFQSAFAEYQRCAAGLLPVNFSQIERSTVFWPSGTQVLTPSAKQLLDNIILYVDADPSVTGFEVDSFTDTAGERRENLLISEERAFLVTNYLIASGIDPERIATRAHGEREEYLIVKPEKTAADRNRNRRVNVVLLRSSVQLGMP
jgi:outer membrane protein OmpA-like peptidoglycan-associated protein